MAPQRKPEFQVGGLTRGRLARRPCIFMSIDKHQADRRPRLASCRQASKNERTIATDYDGKAAIGKRASNPTTHRLNHCHETSQPHDARTRVALGGGWSELQVAIVNRIRV